MRSMSRLLACMGSARLDSATNSHLIAATSVFWRSFAIERDLGVGATPRPGELVAKDPYAAKDAGFDTELEDKMKKYSGTAEDVHVKDKEKGSMKKMMADPSSVEKEYKEKAFDVAKSAYERSPHEN